MCGIAGYYGTKPPSDVAIQSCLSLMGRRGPDSTGTFSKRVGSDRHVQLLHSRLSILDLDSRSNQPFLGQGKVLVYNGEIYNYLEVREKLERESIKFHTTSDTEVLFRSLSLRGISGLENCEGMWAFAFYDENEGSLWLCRDRFGEKPLYVWEREHGIYFGSEPKFLFSLAGERAEVNIEHILRYLIYGFRVLYKNDECFFQGLRLLPQATVLVALPDGRLEERQYWTPRGDAEIEISYEEAVSGVRERMLEAIRIRLRSDVPLSFCMSGGVDSNALVSVAKRIFEFDVHGFTFTTPDPRYHEMDIIKQSVRELGIRHSVVDARAEEFVDKLRILIRYHDSPIHTVTWYANWLLLSEIAGQGYKIALSGIAADEIFSGYYDHHLAFLYDMRAMPELFDKSLKAWQEKIRPLVRNPHLKDPAVFLKDPMFRDHLVQNGGMFSVTLRKKWCEQFAEKRFSKSLLRNRMMNELVFENVPVYTHEEDLNAMYFSVENRSPYLDRRLFDFCRKIPTQYLIREGHAKALLRDSMQGIVPDCVLNNPKKVGFNAPIFAFLRPKEETTRSFLMDDSPVYEHVQKECVESLLGEEVLTNTQSKFLFAVLNCKIFLEEYA